MSLLANSNAIETGGYQISRSVRLRASATPYFDRTPASTSGNNTWTFSCWVKRGSDIGSTSTQESIMGAGDGGGAPARYDIFGFYNDTIQFFTFNGSVASIYTTAVYRDPSAWYHLVCRYDDTQSTASNRVRIYVNGVLQTLNSPTYPNQNYGSNFNTTYLQRIAANTIATNRGIDGYLAEVIMVSGQSLDPSSFGQTDANTGVWVAKKYVGSHGTNGFYLPFNLDSIIFSADYLVVAGGGGGGYGGGGGGAGGLLTGNTNLEVNVPYAVKVGAGGNGSTSAGVGGNIGNLGNESKFSTFIGGGGGAGGSSNNGVYNVNITPGSGAYALNGNGAGGAYTASSAGGSGSNAGYSGGAGNGSVSGSGGGSGGNGSTGGAGGAGTISSITGSSVTYATGGGSSGSASGGANTGNGGGGGGSGANSGGNGGSGVVIIKIPNTRTATFSSGVSSSLSTAVSGYKIYTVTATSTTSETVIFS